MTGDKASGAPVKVKPGTVPALSQTQKTQVNNKLGSTITDINNSLKSLDDVKDIDLSGVN